MSKLTVGLVGWWIFLTKAILTRGQKLTGSNTSIMIYWVKLDPRTNALIEDGVINYKSDSP